ncbi:hypothetical protein [Bacteroides uniformis]|uniref:hypothetical protein n=1 Tax=Bacteroides uniformis TaxID=820 RepID=UPI003F26083F
MNNITKYNLKTFAISAIGLILLFCVLTYISAPKTDGFEFSSINPLGFLEGAAFALGFGLGFPLWLSVIVISAVSFLIFMAFLWLCRRYIK